MSEVQIKVNTFNRLKKIRSGVVYESITTVIDELLQNCQRSFSLRKNNTYVPTIDIITNGDLIGIRDNGDGCDNPQNIFEFETSGWEISGAFGQGGSESVFQIADSITIMSQDWKATVDVLNVLETENLNVSVEEIGEFFEGYEILLTGDLIRKQLTSLELHIHNMVQYFSCNVYINGEIVTKKNLRDISVPFKVDFENQFYVATLGVMDGLKDCEVYYEKRKVCDIWKHGVYGIIELKAGTVNLKSPDRKSIIKDSKYWKFTECLDRDCESLYKIFVQRAHDDQFEKLSDRIVSILKPKDYIEYLPVHSTEKYLEQEVPNSKTVEDLNDAVRRSYYSGSPSRTIEASVSVKKEFVREKGAFKKELGKILNFAWCEFNRKDELVELINKANQANITVHFSKGKLYSEAFKFLGMPHVEDLMNISESRYIIGSVGGSSDNRDYTKKEDRLLNVLRSIEGHYGLSDVFRIADVQSHISIEHNGETVVDLLMKQTAAPIKDRQKIYLDRSSLNLSKVDIRMSKSAITKFDALIVMLNINTIASGLSRLVYSTIENTVDHYVRVDKISKEIALLMATL